MLSFYAIVSVIHVLCKLINEFSANFYVRFCAKWISDYTAVSRKVVQKKHKSVRDNAERHYGKLSV